MWAENQPHRQCSKNKGGLYSCFLELNKLYYSCVRSVGQGSFWTINFTLANASAPKFWMVNFHCPHVPGYAQKKRKIGYFKLNYVTSQLGPN